MPQCVRTWTGRRPPPRRTPRTPDLIPPRQIQHCGHKALPVGKTVTQWRPPQRRLLEPERRGASADSVLYRLKPFPENLFSGSRFGLKVARERSARTTNSSLFSRRQCPFMRPSRRKAIRPVPAPSSWPPLAGQVGKFTHIAGFICLRVCPARSRLTS